MNPLSSKLHFFTLPSILLRQLLMCLYIHSSAPKEVVSYEKEISFSGHYKLFPWGKNLITVFLETVRIGLGREEEYISA